MVSGMKCVILLILFNENFRLLFIFQDRFIGATIFYSKFYIVLALFTENIFHNFFKIYFLPYITDTEKFSTSRGKIEMFVKLLATYSPLNLSADFPSIHCFFLSATPEVKFSQIDATYSLKVWYSNILWLGWNSRNCTKEPCSRTCLVPTCLSIKRTDYRSKFVETLSKKLFIVESPTTRLCAYVGIFAEIVGLLMSHSSLNRVPEFYSFSLYEVTIFQWCPNL